MANKKTRKRHKNSKLNRTNKGTLIKRAGVKKKPAVKSKPVKQKLVKSKKAAKKVSKPKKAPTKAAKKASKPKKTSKKALKRASKSKRAPKKAAKKVRTKRITTITTLTLDESEILDATVLSSPREIRPSGGQSGDLQGLSGDEIADSESIEELLEEGNAFEAGVLIGVQDADDGNLEEVQTHQVPEDDVPREYLDND